MKEDELVLRVTKESFISGKKFCELYVNTSEPKSKEYGITVLVPKDYDHPEEKIALYAYTRKPYDPKLPSYIFIDGGPGQNTHQADDILPEGFNQINFDQRGVGCSVADTWEEYIDAKKYSSLNTVKDIDEIRKFFKINIWSIYGLSYGTIPATIYASMFSDKIKSVTLEGVVGSVENLSKFKNYTEKWNIVLNNLNEKQRMAFNKFIDFSDSERFSILFHYFIQAGYTDVGFKKLKEKILDKIFLPDGTFNEPFFNELASFHKKHLHRFSTPQQPGIVDDNILTMIYCKELNAFAKDKFTLDYDPSKGFFEKEVSNKSTWKNDCERLNIKESDQRLYSENDFPSSKPFYYFQGTHDSATMTIGAWNHWKNVPRGKVYFLLSSKGGHNPALSKVFSEDNNIKKNHQQLFARAFSDLGITPIFVKTLNESLKDTAVDKYLNTSLWQLYKKHPDNFAKIEKQLEDISFRH